MQIKNKHYQSLWWDKEDNSLAVIDQRLLPHKFSILHLRNSADVFHAIKEMVVRGAPLIGVTAAYGFYLATLEAGEEEFSSYLYKDYEKLLSARPTAVNLKWALDEMVKETEGEKSILRIREKCFAKAEQIKTDDIDRCRKIGEAGVKLIEEIAAKKNDGRVNILTHCNAGWLACVDWGTATAPIYIAKQKGIDVHVYVDETRPRNQGASLTTYELAGENIPHTLITDNAGGHLMQHGMVDIVIVGADRVTADGDVANKIGTYLKALAAHDNEIPFYVTFPSSTIDFSISDGVKEIEIEERSQNEVKFVSGKLNGEIVSVQIAPDETPALNFGFDVTPSWLITGFITEKGVCAGDEFSLEELFGQ